MYHPHNETTLTNVVNIMCYTIDKLFTDRPKFSYVYIACYFETALISGNTYDTKIIMSCDKKKFVLQPSFTTLHYTNYKILSFLSYTEVYLDVQYYNNFPEHQQPR